jgi:hypothetical protein
MFTLQVHSLEVAGLTRSQLRTTSLYFFLHAHIKIYLLLLCGGLGDLSGSRVLLDDGLDDTDGDGLTHVTHGETAERSVISEGLDAHGLLGHKDGDTRVTRLDELGCSLKLLAGAAVDLGDDLSELAGNVASVAVEHGGVPVANLTRVVQNDDLSGEVVGLTGGVVLGVTSDVATTDFLDGNVLDVEPNVVTRDGLLQGLVVHLNGLDLSCDVDGGEGDDHARLEDTGLNTADGDCADTADLVHVLQGEAKRLVGGALGRLDHVEGLKECGALVPRHLVRAVDHVVAVPAGDGDEVDLVGVVANLLEVLRNVLLDLKVTLLRVVGRLLIHLVNANNHLLDTEGVRKESVLTGLAVL